VHQNDERFMDTAEEMGFLDAETYDRAKAILDEIEKLGQPVNAEDVLEIKGLLTAAEIRTVKSALEARVAEPIQRGRAATEATVIPMDSIDADDSDLFRIPVFEDAGGDGSDAIVIPQVVPSFELVTAPGFTYERDLGKSVVGPIQLCRETTTGRLATVKLIQHEGLADTELRARFLELCGRLQEVKGAHVVDVLGAGLMGSGDPPVGFVAAAGVAGTTLRKRLKTSIPQRDWLRFGLGVARGLQVLHGLGITHGALRPSNVFLEHGRRIKVGGFELGALLRSLRLQLSEPPAAEPYRALELAPGRASKLGDIYSLGVLLYRGFCDRFPDPDPKQPAEVLQVIDRKANLLVMACLSPEPIKRPNIDKVVAVLEPLVGKAAIERVRGD
jgi:serine/threonine protein kinase